MLAAPPRAASLLPPALARLARLVLAPAARLSATAPGPAAATTTTTTERCTLAAGCFWGVEHLFRRHFANKGLVAARVGYTGGAVADPTYRAVCAGKTGHAEAVQLDFDPALVSYRQLLEFFYRIHDPTTPDRQGPDAGPQYRSAIFFHDAQQEAVARDVTRRANNQWWHGALATHVVPAGPWWSAEEYHQLYLQNNPGGYECPSHCVRSFPPLVD